MTARAARASSATDRHRTATGAQTRLPWWAVALPVLAFAVLLILLVGGGRADAADQQGPAHRPVAHVLDGFEQVLAG